MKNEYLEHIKWDEKLHNIIKSEEKNFEKLSQRQIELIVLYLKNVGYSNFENKEADSIDFSKTLDKERNSLEQKKLQKRSSFSLLKGIGLCVLSGVIFSGSVLFFVSNEKTLGCIAFLIAIFFLIISESKFFQNAILISKEQDRRFFLKSIRAAKNCDELDQSGFFAYTPSWEETGTIEFKKHKEIVEIVKNLRKALYSDSGLAYTNT